MRLFADESWGSSGKAFAVDGLRPLVGVPFFDFGSGSWRAVTTEIGVEDFGVPERGVPSPDLGFGGGGFHSAFSLRWTGRCLERIDWTGGAYLEGIGGGLGGGDSACC